MRRLNKDLINFHDSVPPKLGLLRFENPLIHLYTTLLYDLISALLNILNGARIYTEAEIF